MESRLGRLEFQEFPFNDLIGTQYLFNTNKYLSEYDTDGLIRWSYRSQNGNEYSLTGIVQEGKFSSIPWGTFGGFEIGKESEQNELDEFISLVISAAEQMEINQLKIKLPPCIYLDQSPHLKPALLSHNFKSIQSDINQHIKVDSAPYRKHLSYNELKKLRKSEKEGFNFKKLERSNLTEAYQLIRDNRLRKGFPVSMTFEALDNMFEKLPNHYHLFGVYNQDKMIATAISIKVKEASLYNFYHGDDQDYRVYSPIVMLLDGIYGYCQQHQVEILDLGISSDQGELNEGLYKFKKNCGALPSTKDVMVKVMN